MTGSELGGEVPRKIYEWHLLAVMRIKYGLFGIEPGFEILADPELPAYLTAGWH
jgi:hypothetical protein